MIEADTTLVIELEPYPLRLDSLLVRAGTVRVRGAIVDALAGLRVLYTEVTFDPKYPPFVLIVYPLRATSSQILW